MLTRRELDVLLRRARGESQQEIAAALAISQAAVSQFETKGQRKILEMERQLELVKRLGIETTEGVDGKQVGYRGGKR